MKADEIVSRLREHRAALDGYKVERLWLFGSAARGEREPRDIDLLVEFSQAPTLVEFIELKNRLETILGKPVDLLSKRGCKERFLKQIAHELQNVA